MPRYRYTVINQENKQLQGTIGAPDEQSARLELNDLGFSIVELSEITEESGKTASEMPIFEFAALDKNQKHVVGTIQAEDPYKAFIRLISEYDFEVEYVIDNELPEKDKETERKKGAYDLYSKYQEENAVKNKETSDEKDLKEFEKKQAVLKQQIDFVLAKVKSMLDDYEKDMLPETKEKIRRYVEKILRIKSSTNLDYIRKTAEEMLLFLQKEELFLHESGRNRDKTRLLVEAKSMMMQLKKGQSKTSVNLTDKIRQWHDEHITNVNEPSSLDKFLDFIFIIHVIHSTILLCTLN